MIARTKIMLAAAAASACLVMSGCTHSDSNSAVPAATSVQNAVNTSQMDQAQKENVQGQISAAQQAASAQSKALAAQSH